MMTNTTMLATAMRFGERVAYAGRMTLIGMVTVFVALAILWGALELFHVAVRRAEKRRGAKSVVPPASTPVPPTVAPAPVAPASVAPAASKPVAPVAQNADDGAVVAAITAAVSLLLAEENGGTVPHFRVVSFRRTRGSSK